MQFIKRKFWLFAVGIIMVGGIVYAFLPTPVEVDTARVTRGPMDVTVDHEGKTRVKERYVVSAPLQGRMQRIDLRAGDAVETGKTVLTTIEPNDPALLDDRERARAEALVKASDAARKRASPNLERARQTYDLAQRDHARAKKLLGTRSISQQEFENAESKERIAQNELKSAQFALQIAEFEYELAQSALLRTKPRSPGDAESWRLEIRSPIRGKVLRVFQESSTIVTPGLRLIELGDPAELECEIDLLSTDAVKVSPGAKVRLEHWGGDAPLSGRVRLVEPAAFTKISALGVEEQRVYVIVDFTDPLAKRKTLGDAYRVEARIVIWENSDVKKVASGALFRHGEQWTVYRLANGKAWLQPIEIGRNNGVEAEVLAGLEPNDVVIVHASDRVKHGVAVIARQ